MRWTTCETSKRFRDVDQRLLERAEAFARDRYVLAVWAEFEAEEGPSLDELSRHFERHGGEIPKGLTVVPLGSTGILDPDYVPWTIQLSGCMTFFKADESGASPRQQTVCFSFEIVPG
jgi:hypothetical protein